jgi:hypothetical protein
MALPMVTSLFVPAASAQEDGSAPKAEWPKTMYQCRHRAPLDGFGGTLEFDTLYTEDGAIFSEGARWTSGYWPLHTPLPAHLIPARSIILPAGQPNGMTVMIEWPGGSVWDKTPTPDPSAKAVMRIVNIDGVARTMRKKERWHQSVVVRNSEVLPYSNGEDRMLFLSPLEPALITNYGQTSNMDLTIPVANLLAWGSGLETLTVFDIFVEPRKYDPNSFPNGPAGQMRVVGEYRIDMGALAAAFDKIRSEHRNWRAGLADFKANCEATEVEDPSMEIIVT